MESEEDGIPLVDVKAAKNQFCRTASCFGEPSVRFLKETKPIFNPKGSLGKPRVLLYGMHIIWESGISLTFLNFKLV